MEHSFSNFKHGNSQTIWFLTKKKEKSSIFSTFCIRKKRKNMSTDAIDILKANCVGPPTKSFKDLEPGEYPVSRFRVVKTPFGNSVCMEVEDCVMFLPERFVKKMDAKVIKSLNASNVVMSFKGYDKEKNGRLMLDFNIIED